MNTTPRFTPEQAREHLNRHHARLRAKHGGSFLHLTGREYLKALAETHGKGAMHDILAAVGVHGYHWRGKVEDEGI